MATMKLGELIKHARQRAGWTQGELARRAGLSHGNHVAMIEAGKRPHCAPRTLIKLSATLKIDLEQIMKAAAQKAA